MMKRHNDRRLAAYLTSHFSIYFQEHLKRIRDEKKSIHQRKAQRWECLEEIVLLV